MQIDKDIPMGNSKPAKLTNTGGKNIPKKPIMIGIGIIILVIIIALILSFQPAIEETPAPIINYSCEKRLNLDLGGITAVFADGSTKNDLISAKGEDASYIQLYESKKLIEAIPNTYIGENIEEEIVNLLLEKNVDHVATADASQEMKNRLHRVEINCYSIGGAISEYVGADPIPADTSFCQKLVDQNLIGKVAFGADLNIEESLIAIKISESPFLIVYQDLTYDGVLENTALDSNYPVDDFITLIQNEGIKTIVVAEYEIATEEKLKDANINCYEAGGVIKGKV
ncbi:MAG: hypothetical protein HON47_02195 [Candidatus Diapherotrites archaeon]|uniref:Uncharacterized protein n=1 Tax=Candidatus Iainarchaeum sp. TaxID=3101447 RepID=A0A8T5GF81_9ARCH|nr:hypothetical protein [Candidatus Diapherotrites archaeon]MBT7240991.1 hypothetical protein [Candidatus Diapherotrites archaeon]